MTIATLIHALRILDEPDIEEQREIDEADDEGDRIAVEQSYVGWYAYEIDHYDGSPDSLIGHGMTPEEAKADLLEQLRD